MSELTRDGTAKPVSRDRILGREREQGKNYFLCSAHHEQDWQTCPVDSYYALCDDHTYKRKVENPSKLHVEFYSRTTAVLFPTKPNVSA